MATVVGESTWVSPTSPVVRRALGFAVPCAVDVEPVEPVQDAEHAARHDRVLVREGLRRREAGVEGAERVLDVEPGAHEDVLDGVLLYFVAHSTVPDLSVALAPLSRLGRVRAMLFGEACVRTSTGTQRRCVRRSPCVMTMFDLRLEDREALGAGPEDGSCLGLVAEPVLLESGDAIVIDSRRSLAPEESRMSVSESGAEGPSARASPGSATSAARNSRAASSHGLTLSLATATPACRHAVPPRRSLAGVVDLLPAVGVGGLVGEAHHGIGETCAPVLRDGGAPGERREEQESRREPHLKGPLPS